MPNDRYGLALTTSPAAAAAYVDAVDRLLAAREGALEGFDRALAADPGFALAHIGRSRSLLVAGRGNRIYFNYSLCGTYSIESIYLENSQKIENKIKN